MNPKIAKYKLKVGFDILSILLSKYGIIWPQVRAWWQKMAYFEGKKIRFASN